MTHARLTPTQTGGRGGLLALAIATLAPTVAFAQPRIEPAPAFDAERLSTLPTDEWITNGGTLAKQRYSPLTPDNEAGLKGKWRTGMGSGANPGNSGQAQILVYEGGLYFDPETNLLYVCATDRVGSYAVTLPLAPPVDNQPYFGGSLGQSVGAPDRGIFAALDVRTNRIAWRQQWAEHCYSGSVVTRGGFVFVGVSTTGRNNMNMPAFGEVYSADELRAVSAYITEILGRDR